MTKETVRFPDDLVGRIKDAVDESDLFESRSEFHRVSSELLLDLLDPDHEPTNFSYRELRAEIENEVGFSLDGSAGTERPSGAGADGEFLEAYVTVRRRALHGDLEGAREYVSDRYDPVTVESLLLDEVIGLHRSERPVEGTARDRDDGTPEAGTEFGIADGGNEAGTEAPPAGREDGHGAPDADDGSAGDPSPEGNPTDDAPPEGPRRRPQQ